MSSQKKIKTALVSVFHKDGLDEILTQLYRDGVVFYSTGGTQTFIESLGMPCRTVENLTGYPSILGGRVKTLHPKVFGGILNRRDNPTDKQQIKEWDIPEIDLVIVDLYPFSETVASGAPEADIIEKIDIGGISLIRAAAKNFNDVVIVASKNQYGALNQLLTEKGANSTLDDRKWFAKEAFAVSSGYDTAIFNYFDGTTPKTDELNDTTYFRQAYDKVMPLRYGENPHQKGVFYGDFDALFKQLHGKEISYNNLLDINAAIDLISEFDELTFAVLKHNNACGIASRPTVKAAWEAALAGDPVSAFGGVLICNAPIDAMAAEEINKIFLEVIIAPAYDADALEILKQKKNRIILVLKNGGIAGQARNDGSVGTKTGAGADCHCVAGCDPQSHQQSPDNHTVQFRSLLNGALVQDKDLSIQTKADLKTVTVKSPTAAQVDDLLFANKLVKNTKSNAIVLAKDKQLCASGVGQTSRIDALKQAIAKAHEFGFDLNGAVMASDAFFPFPDCVEVAKQAGITAVIQPGGSIKDDLSIEYCNNNDLVMVTTGVRHFKH
ncbi:MAG: bifunctional phosphoribosylaminoimidazolecarboxamide formyltransferase/IMP cyclohydrolase [Candidatus Symbiothrix sp.]|jgi:phosphoribosylaminoimidazolecarboxamide formyltransferase/IMP cyclohydrolase|nr:bifunctional phosphoribosylaminoimidazolecarboxamide formyltransferase/IMP cyclohydrolase [Candidatus Symbiothrix sp.]